MHQKLEITYEAQISPNAFAAIHTRLHLKIQKYTSPATKTGEHKDILHAAQTIYSGAQVFPAPTSSAEKFAQFSFSYEGKELFTVALLPTSQIEIYLQYH